MSETKILGEIMEYLEKSAHGKFYRINQIARKRGRKMKVNPGMSDIIGYLNGGRFCAIEVKQPKEKPTLEQAAFIAEVNKRGGVAFVSHSVEEIVEHFKHLRGKDES